MYSIYDLWQQTRGFTVQKSLKYFFKHFKNHIAFVMFVILYTQKQWTTNTTIDNTYFIKYLLFITFIANVYG